MKKEIFNKKLELFKQLGEVQVSKSKNYYIKSDTLENEREINTYSTFSVTKKNHHLVYTKKFKLKTKTSNILLLTKSGGLKIKFRSGPWYWIKRRSRGIRHISHQNNIKDILKVSFTGSKYEYLSNYPELTKYNLAYDFTSLDEFKEYLGFSDISEMKFLWAINKYPEVIINAKIFPGNTLESVKTHLQLGYPGFTVSIFMSKYCDLFIEILNQKDRIEVPVNTLELQRLMGIMLHNYKPADIDYTMIEMPF